MDDLFLRDGLLYIAFLVLTYGMKVINENFVYGAVALVFSAGLVVVRTLMKKHGYEAKKK